MIVKTMPEYNVGDMWSLDDYVSSKYIVLEYVKATERSEKYARRILERDSVVIYYIQDKSISRLWADEAHKHILIKRNEFLSIKELIKELKEMGQILNAVKNVKSALDTPLAGVLN